MTETVEQLLAERVDGSIESTLWHRSRGSTHYGLVASLTDDERLNLSTVVLDLSDETLRIHADNSMWLPADDPDVLNGVMRTVATGVNRARAATGDPDSPIRDSLLDQPADLIGAIEIDDEYDPDSGDDWKAREGRDGIEEVRELLAESPIDEPDRMIRLEMEGKAPWSGETRRIMRSPDEIAGNYGVEVSEEDDLVILDVDDLDLVPLDRLPETMTVESPHEGRHFYFHAPGWREAFRERFDGTENPHPEYGEIRSQDGYVVGPGSLLTSCKHTDCCTEEDPGEYAIDPDPIATIEAEALADLLAESRGETA